MSSVQQQSQRPACTSQQPPSRVLPFPIRSFPWSSLTGKLFTIADRTMKALCVALFAFLLPFQSGVIPADYQPLINCLPRERWNVDQRVIYVDPDPEYARDDQARITACLDHQLAAIPNLTNRPPLDRLPGGPWHFATLPESIEHVRYLPHPDSQNGNHATTYTDYQHRRYTIGVLITLIAALLCSLAIDWATAATPHRTRIINRAAIRLAAFTPRTRYWRTLASLAAGLIVGVTTVHLTMSPLSWRLYTYCADDIELASWFDETGNQLVLMDSSPPATTLQTCLGVPVEPTGLPSSYRINHQHWYITHPE